MVDKVVIKELEKIVGSNWVISHPTETELYSYDASFERGLAEIVILPENAEQVAAVLKILYRAKIPFTPRGAGTCLSGGAVPQGGAVIMTTRMRRILSIDPTNRLAIVEPGVVNQRLSNEVAKYGLTFAPDPSSYSVSTLGGNTAENAGGPHCLKYGTSTHHVTALELVTPQGEIIELGSPCADMPGPDWVGLIAGSEGTLGIITKLTLRLIPKTEDVRTILITFKSTKDSGNFIADLVSSLTPVAIEFMDRTAVKYVQMTMDAGYPENAAFVVIVEVDGYEEEVNEQASLVEEIAKKHHAEMTKIAANQKERDALWLGRRGLGSSFGSSTKAYISTDFSVPRSKLAEMLKRVEMVAKQYDLVIPSAGHAGDGNLHPAVFYDPADSEMVKRAYEASQSICKIAIELGGTSTGEHGVGLEKKFAMPIQFTPQELKFMDNIKNLFDPQKLCNPGKIFPDEEKRL